MQYLILLVLFLSVHVCAFELCGDDPYDNMWIRLGLWSKHNDTTKTYNETHNQLGLDYGQCTILYMKNSSGDDTLVAARKTMWDMYNNSNVNVSAGVSYGAYIAEDDYVINSPIGPMIMPVVEFELFDRVSIDINILPTVVTTVGFRFKF